MGVGKGILFAVLVSILPGGIIQRFRWFKVMVHCRIYLDNALNFLRLNDGSKRLWYSVSAITVANYRITTSSTPAILA